MINHVPACRPAIHSLSKIPAFCSTKLCVCSPAPSPQRSVSQAGGEAAGGVGRTMRARASHQPAASNRTMLPFSKGELITVLVPQPKKGWLYGQAESSTQ